MKVRKYEARDEKDCLRIFDSNIDPFFDPEEKQQFLTCLRDPAEMEHYYVIEDTDAGVVACGGFVQTSIGDVVLSWGMVERELHRKGVGRMLLEHRLKLIDRLFPGAKIRTDTSQYTEGFFKRYGFETQKVEPNAFGAGIDKVRMLRENVS